MIRPSDVRITDLISPEYLDQQRALHMAPRGFGGKGSRWADTVAWVAKRYNAGSILDYGCGQGTLACAVRLLGVECREYDPAISGKDQRPMFADLVVCTDVLEHIEPEKLPAVLAHIRALARKAVFLVVSLRDANKVLPDGRNAHLIVRPPAWWEAKCDEHGLTVVDCPDLPRPDKVSPEKAWVAVLTP